MFIEKILLVVSLFFQRVFGGITLPGPIHLAGGGALAARGRQRCRRAASRWPGVANNAPVVFSIRLIPTRRNQHDEYYECHKPHIPNSGGLFHLRQSGFSESA